MNEPSELTTAMRMAESGSAANWPMVAGVLHDEIVWIRKVITEYVNEVDNGEKFGALVELVPGLASDDGQHGAVDPNPGAPVIGRIRFADGTRA